MLLASINGESGRGGEHRVLETRLVVRRSTAPVATRRQEVISNA